MNIYSSGSSEVLIDFLWRHFPDMFYNITTTCGDVVSIDDFGCESGDSALYNYDGVAVRCGNNLVKGAVKFMDDSISWESWNKQNPEIVRKIVLVVVASNGAYNVDYSQIPSIVINIPRDLSQMYLSLTMSGKDYCPSYLARYSGIERESLLTRLLIERLEYKEEYVRKCSEMFRSNYSETLIYLLFDTLMIATRNREAMRELCKSIRYGSVISQLTSCEQVEALLIGNAGLLDARFFADDYIWSLRAIYKEIASRFDLVPMSSSRWTISSSNPYQTIWVQLSQLAAVVFHHKELLFKVIYAHSLQDLINVFMIPSSPYWHTHNYPGKEQESVTGAKFMSESKRNLFLINSIIPFMFFYNRENSYDGGDAEYVDVLISFLISLAPESNKYTRNWTTDGFANSNAFDSQALIHLSKAYCEGGRCHLCPIGTRILKNSIEKSSLEYKS